MGWTGRRDEGFVGELTGTCHRRSVGLRCETYNAGREERSVKTSCALCIVGDANEVVRVRSGTKPVGENESRAKML